MIFQSKDDANIFKNLFLIAKTKTNVAGGPHWKDIPINGDNKAIKTEDIR